jgi:protein-L-isoaspartate O-methyltransferase
MVVMIDLIQEDINFQDIATASKIHTNDIIFAKRKEALLQIPRSSFVNEPSLTDAPTTIDINNSNRWFTAL